MGMGWCARGMQVWMGGWVGALKNEEAHTTIFLWGVLSTPLLTRHPWDPLHDH